MLGAKQPANDYFLPFIFPTMPPVRVVFCHYDMPSDVGGVSTWIQNIAPDLRKRGIDVRVHITNSSYDKPGPNILQLESAGVPVRWAKPPRTFRAQVRQFVEWLNLDRPDVYIPNGILAATSAAGYARSFGLPSVGVLHSDDASTAAFIEDFVIRDQKTRFSTVVAVSDYLRKSIAALHIPNLQCHQIPCGIPIPIGKTTYAQNQFRIAYIGRLVEEQKQISAVTRALCEAARRHSTLEALIVGDGPAHPSVAGIIAESHVESRVRLTGRLSNLQVGDLLKTVQAFVLLSDYEGLPVSLLEAMATGVVPICLRMRSGVEEVVRSGINGILVSNRDEEFQAAVSQLIAEKATWHSYSNEARRTVEQTFSMEICHQKWISVFTSVINPASSVKYPIPLPLRITLPHPTFAWREPDLLERMLLPMTRLRDRLRHWRRNRISI